jgi:tryptophan 2,3-dioxygenase
MLNSPSLYDDVIALLARPGLALPAERLCRNWADRYEPHPAVKTAWLEVYKAPTADNNLYRLAEALIEIDELFAQYPWRHFSAVQRILGLKPGTGRSDGVGWLRKTLDLRSFPELWAIRTVMGA